MRMHSQGAANQFEKGLIPSLQQLLDQYNLPDIVMLLKKGIYHQAQVLEEIHEKASAHQVLH